MASKPQLITDAQLAVMKVLWDRGPLSAKAITEVIYPNCSESDFASVHSFLQKLEAKGLVERDRSEFVHRFKSKVSQSEIAGQELKALAERLSDGALAPFLTHLLSHKRLDETEAAEIRRLLDQHFPSE
jgi:BlaI family transcriptional regulator, penicillinase repressor